MSGIVLNEKLIDPTTIKKTNFQIERIESMNMGVRIWFQIQTTNKVMFQRWSMWMNPTDEVLILAKKGDNLEITYIEDHVEDPINETFEPFDRNIIITAKFV